MRVTRYQAESVSGIGLGVALGVLLAGITVAGWNGPGTRTIAAKTLVAPKAKSLNATRRTLEPIQAAVCVSPPSGMISWWPGDGNANDIQDGNNGTLVGSATFAPGMVGQAFSLGGVNDWIAVPDADNLDVSSQITIDAWINPSVLGGRIVDKITPGGSDGYVLDVLGGKVRFVFSGAEISGSTTLPTGVFTHVAGTYDFSTLNVYVNGVLDGTLSAEELALSPNNLPLRIGADQSGADTFTGLIDEVEIFDRALSQPEIQSIFDASSAGKCKDTCVLTCPGDIAQANDFNQCGAVVNFAPTSSVCGTVTCAPASGSFFSVGPHVVTCTASAGPNCSFNVTVNDTEPPIMVCPDITKSTDPNQCNAVVDYSPNLATDNCPGVGVVCNPASHSTFNKGTTMVSCTATDASTNSATCDFTVTINDTQPPGITCPLNIARPNDPGQCGAVVTYPPPNASDNCPGVGIPGCSPASGSFFSVGTTTVMCNVADSSGNTAMCTFTVTVNNTQPPTITCPANITKSNDPNQCGAVVTYPPPTVSDNCPVTGTVCSPASGSFFPRGTTTVTCTTTAGPSCMFTVTVNDTQPPVITCPSSVNSAGSTSCPPTATGGSANFTVTATDNCPGTTVVCRNQNNEIVTAGSAFPLGTTAVTCTATDTSGNTAACSFPVTVFSGCLQDDSDPSKVVLFNAQTGQYRFCCGGTTFTGAGILTVRGCVVSIQHNAPDRRVQINTDGNSGTASLQSPPGTIRCTIQDRNVRNNSCACQ